VRLHCGLNSLVAIEDGERQVEDRRRSLQRVSKHVGTDLADLLEVEAPLVFEA
jgi:hypothetical protein